MKPNTKRLQLGRTTLRTLTGDALAMAAGASNDPGCQPIAIPVFPTLGPVPAVDSHGTSRSNNPSYCGCTTDLQFSNISKYVAIPKLP
jgi:hypothetical protein